MDRAIDRILQVPQQRFDDRAGPVDRQRDDQAAAVADHPGSRADADADAAAVERNFERRVIQYGQYKQHDGEPERDNAGDADQRAARADAFCHADTEAEAAIAGEHDAR